MKAIMTLFFTIRILPMKNKSISINKRKDLLMNSNLLFLWKNREIYLKAQQFKNIKKKKRAVPLSSSSLASLLSKDALTLLRATSSRYSPLRHRLKKAGHKRRRP